MPARDRCVPAEEKEEVVAAAIPLRHATPGLELIGWIALTDLMVVAALGFVALRSDWRGWKLGAALAAIPFTVALVNIVEALFYLKEADLEGPRLLLQAALTFAAVAPIWGRIFSAGREAAPANYRPYGSRGIGQRAWRFVASDFAYLFGYVAAGLTIFPLVRDFYATRTLPLPGVILALQLLARGPLFIAVCVLLVRMAGLPRATGVAVVGAIFALVSGVAPLLLPTPYLPDAVRWVHFFEVSTTNVLFGALVAAMWGPPKVATV